MNRFNFSDLFVYDMANNHQGDMAHASNIIREFGRATKENNVFGALKFQFRQLDTFIHPDYQSKKDVQHIPRFMETALSIDNYRELTKAVHENGMTSICTPFDEESVDIISDLGIQVVKIASCSAADWPLLEKVAKANKPVIVSTAGLSMERIDNLVGFFEANRLRFALMHCVAIYPTPNDKLKLNQISLMKERFPHLTIGFSTHEAPDNLNPVRVAYGLGARIFERHVGIETKKYKLNAYSSTPTQVTNWIQAWKETVAACGGEHRSPASPDEMASLKSLMRGVYAGDSIKKGQEIKREQVFFAMPLQENQAKSGDWKEGMIASYDYEKNKPLHTDEIHYVLSEDDIIYQIMLQVRGMLNKARIFVGKDSTIELSHHYGLERFREYGAVIINCINREYCKKLIILLPRQKHPVHFHKRKEETFQLLYGDLGLEVDGTVKVLKLGDTVLVKPKEWHKFHTLYGAIFEEVSTTHYDNDSIYDDELIARLDRNKRKTVVSN